MGVLSTYNRDLVALAHYTQAQLISDETVDLLDDQYNPVIASTGMPSTGLSAIVRVPTLKEAATIGLLLQNSDRVVELARQTNFDASNIRVQAYKIRTSVNITYEIIALNFDDTYVVAGGIEERAVHILFCRADTASVGILATEM